MSGKNILKIYNLSTPAERRYGVTWYANAYSDCERIANLFGLPVNVGVGVVSALSPNNKLERNIENAHVMCEAFIDGDEITSFPVSTYNAMKEKAWQILNATFVDEDGTTHMLDDEVAKILNGQKIKSFFQCILGYDTCCVDGHALGIYEGRRFPLTSPSNYINKTKYVEIQDAYRNAGAINTYRKKSLRAYEMQAITWLTWKRLHDIN